MDMTHDHMILWWPRMGIDPVCVCVVRLLFAHQKQPIVCLHLMDRKKLFFILNLNCDFQARTIDRSVHRHTISIYAFHYVQIYRYRASRYVFFIH